MPQHLTCPRGHQWEPRGEERASARPPVCPVCGAAHVGEAQVVKAAHAGLSGTVTDQASAETILPPPAAAPVSASQETVPPPARAVGEPRQTAEAAKPPGAGLMGETLMPPPAAPPAPRVEANAETLAPPQHTRSGAADATLDTLAPKAPSAPSAMARDSGVPGYEILGLLGRGGMGIVYKARQVRLNRLVALKMMLSGSHAEPEELNRFRSEGEAVARLQHPHIVQIFEVGEQAGRPYFSLEFLEGGSLDRKINGKPQPPRAAADLVEKLARAMAVAHQHGIIHRDLKPANVLLTSEGAPKITDFGLAKKLEEDQSHTRTGAIMGTPSYMAPEQASGKIKELGPAADIYSLGAILYDLLTGRPPFLGATVLDTLNQVQSEEPVHPTRLQPKVPADLETICLKCLQKEPRKRYANAETLAEDLNRFLSGLPILARRTPPWERAWKWARRRPAAAALVAVVSVMILGGVAGALIFAQIEYQQADKERGLKLDAEVARDEARNKSVLAQKARDEAKRESQRAEDNFRQSQEAMDNLTVLGAQRLVNVPGMEKVREVILHKALEFYSAFKEPKSNDPGARSASGRAYQRVGDIQQMLGETAAAEKSYRQAEARLGSLVAEFQDQPDYRDNLARYRQDLARCRHNHGNLLRRLGRIDQARQAFQDALGLRQGLVDAYPRQDDYREELAASFTSLGHLTRATGPAEAEAYYRKALRQQQRRVRPDPLEEARTYNDLGSLLADTGAIAEASRDLRRARDLCRELLKEADEWNKPEYQRELVASENHLGNLWRVRQPRQAAAAYDEAIRLGKELADDFPRITIYRQELAATHNNLGILRQLGGRPAEAVEQFNQALRLKEQLLLEAPTRPGYRSDLAKTLNNLGLLRQSQDQPVEARQAYVRALDLLAFSGVGRFLGSAPLGSPQALPALYLLMDEGAASADYRLEIARTCLNLGTVQQAGGQFPEAEAAYRQARAVVTQLITRRGARPEYEQELGQTYLNLGALLQQQGKGSEANLAYREAVRRFAGLEEKYPGVLDHRYDLAVGYWKQGHLWQVGGHTAEAVDVLRRAADLLAGLRKHQPQAPGYEEQLANADNELGICLSRLPGQYGQAEASFENALRLQKELAVRFPAKPHYQQEEARSHNNLGILLTLTHDTNGQARAQAEYRAAIGILEGLQARYPAPYWRDDLVDSYTNLAGLLAREDKQAAEKTWRLAIGLQQDQVAAAPNQLEHRNLLVRNLQELARVQMELNRPDEARVQLQKAIAYQRAGLRDLDPRHAAYRDGVLAEAETLLQLNDPVAAAASVTRLADTAPLDGTQSMRAARVLAGCMTLVRADSTYSADRREELAGAYGDRAMKLLEQAVRHGHQDVESLKTDKRFDPLRSRGDFKKLLAGPGTVGKSGPAPE